MGSLLATLLMRVIAFVLINYGLTSVDFAVAVTSDPTIFNEVTMGASALVVMLSEDLAKRIGAGPAAVILRILPGFVQRAIDKVTVKKAPK